MNGMGDLIAFLRARAAAIERDMDTQPATDSGQCDDLTGEHQSREQMRRYAVMLRRIAGWADSPALAEHEKLYVLAYAAAVESDDPNYRQEWAP